MPDVPSADSGLAQWVILGLVSVITALAGVVRHLYNKINGLQDRFDQRWAKANGENQAKFERLIAEFTEQSVMMTERLRESNDLMKQTISVLESCRRRNENGQ